MSCAEKQKKWEKQKLHMYVCWRNLMDKGNRMKTL